MDCRVYLDIYFANGSCKTGLCVDMRAWEENLEEEIALWIESAFPGQEIVTYSWQVEWAREAGSYPFD